MRVSKIKKLNYAPLFQTLVSSGLYLAISIILIWLPSLTINLMDFASRFGDYSQTDSLISLIYISKTATIIVLAIEFALAALIFKKVFHATKTRYLLIIYAIRAFIALTTLGTITQLGYLKTLYLVTLPYLGGTLTSNMKMALIINGLIINIIFFAIGYSALSLVRKNKA